MSQDNKYIEVRNQMIVFSMVLFFLFALLVAVDRFAR
jgi:hypothetical protein